MTTVEIGRKAEGEAKAICESLGFDVEDVSRRQLRYDIVVNGLRVQVKNRVRRTYSRREWNTWTIDNNCRPSIPQDAFDVLALRYDGKWYIIPTKALRVRDGMLCVSQNITHTAEYEGRWDLLSRAHDRQIVVRKQLTLF